MVLWCEEVFFSFKPGGVRWTTGTLQWWLGWHPEVPHTPMGLNYKNCLLKSVLKDRKIMVTTRQHISVLINLWFRSIYLKKEKYTISQEYIINLYTCTVPSIHIFYNIYDALKLSFSLRINCIVAIGSLQLAWLWTAPIITLIKGLTFFSSPIVDGTWKELVMYWFHQLLHHTMMIIP